MNSPSTPLPEQGEAMTNYNERLDEIMSKLARDTTLADRAADIATTPRAVNDANEAYQWSLGDAKQAITSLIKELVAEAKPKIDLLDIGVLTGGTIAVDKLGRKNTHAPKDEKKFADSDTIEAHQAAYMVAYKLSSDIFEQNLLKALEEV